jgi:PKD repeat protein
MKKKSFGIAVSLLFLAGIPFLACMKGGPPVADFTASPTSGGVPLIVTFEDQSDPGAENYILNWEWQFGDGSSSGDQYVSHEYTSSGDYTVSLIVENGAGTDTCVKENYIRVLQLPAAGFGAAPRSGTAPLTVQFQDRSAAGSQPISSWVWLFGDGNTSSERNPAHQYLFPGTYTVSLTVGNYLGSNTREREDYITVNPP